MANPVQYQLIQTVNPATTTSASFTLGPTNTRVGSLLSICSFITSSTNSITSIVDNAGNTWTNIFLQQGNTSQGLEQWYSRNSRPTTSVVVTYGDASSTKSIYLREYGGISPAPTALDRSLSIANSAATAMTTGATSARRSASELLICNGFGSGAANTLTVGTNYGNFLSQSAGAATGIHAVEDQTVSIIGTDAGTMTNSGLGTYSIGISTFVITGGKFSKPINILRPHAFSPGLSR